MRDRSCLLTQQQLIDLYFLEMRARVLDLAAFLDRMDRSVEQNGEDDFRMVALRHALQRLSARASSRAYDIQMILSDPTEEPLAELDRKSAFGAFDKQRNGE
jgi:hypothetical protein